MMNSTVMNMKIKAAAAVLMSLALFGCGAESEKKAAQAPAAQSATSAAGHTIVLQTGEKLNATGDDFKEYAKDTANGKMKQYQMKANVLAKVAENDIYTQLKNQGFQRSVMEDTADLFKVHYKKTGFSTIGATFKESSENNANSTKVNIYWTES